MTKSLTKLLILIAIVAAPLLVAAGENKKTESTLAAEIERSLVDVAPNTVIIVVDDATKTAFLRGTVSSQAEADQITSTLEGISGVRVIGSTLVVQGDSETHATTFDEEIQTTTRIVSDASLQEAVEDALKSEGIVGQSKIRVETEGGVVTLTGSALSESHADRIVALAQSVPGVVSVQPNITLRDQKRRYQVKPSDDRDKQGFEPGDAESRTENEDEDDR